MNLSAFADRQLWDLLEEVSFWIKDHEGRFVWVNLTLAAQARAPRAQLVGTFDSDWFYNELASVYMQDDQRVMLTAEPIVNKPELVVSPEGAVRWYATSKFPLSTRKGALRGTYGMSKPMEAAESLPLDYADLSSIVAYARGHLAERLTVSQIARRMGMSLSTLERSVAKHLQITPRQLLQNMRMQRARSLLVHSNLKIAEVADACGYESFSSFSRAFRSTFGFPPGQLRAQPSLAVTRLVLSHVDGRRGKEEGRGKDEG